MFKGNKSTRQSGYESRYPLRELGWRARASSLLSRFRDGVGAAARPVSPRIPQTDPIRDRRLKTAPRTGRDGSGALKYINALPVDESTGVPARYYGNTSNGIRALSVFRLEFSFLCSRFIRLRVL
ncbi:unnamed protein product, partial [Iphiclides podalirius]